MFLPSTAPLPNNSLTPLPQSWADERNARVGLLTLLTNRARAITDCYAPPSSFLEDAGPIVAARVAQAQANASTTAIASGTMDGTPAAQSSGNISSRVAPPVVLPLNQISLGTPGGVSIPADTSCRPQRSFIQSSAPPIPQPVMMMPKPAPAAASVNVQPSPPLAPPHWVNLCWAMRNGAVLQSQFSPADYLSLDWACSQKGYTGACIPPGPVEGYLQQGNLPMIPVSQAIIDAIPQAPDLTGVSCPQSWVMGGLSGIAPPWGSYSRGTPTQGSFDLLTAIQQYPWAAALVVGLGAWGLSKMGKGRR